MKTLKIITVLLTIFVVGFIIELCIKCEKVFSFQYSLSSFEIHPLDKETIMSLMESDVGDERTLEQSIKAVLE